MRYVIAVISLAVSLLTSAALAQPVSVRLPIDIRVTNSRHPAVITTPTGYQVVGQLVASIMSGPNCPEFFELNRCPSCRSNTYGSYNSRSSRSKWITSDGWIQFRSGRDKTWPMLIDPKGMVGNIFLVSERDRTYRQQVCGPTWRFDIPNRPGGPLNEDYYLVVEYEDEPEQRIFTITAENSAPPDIDGLR